MMKYTTSSPWKLMLTVVVILVKDSMSSTAPPRSDQGQGKIIANKRKVDNRKKIGGEADRDMEKDMDSEID